MRGSWKEGQLVGEAAGRRGSWEVGQLVGGKLVYRRGN